MKKNSNELAIIKQLFHNPGLTRSEIAEKLQMRKNTVGSICEALIQAETIREDPPNTHRNTRLFLDAGSFISVGVEHRVDRLHVVLMNANREVIFKCTDALEDRSQKRRIERIRDCLRDEIASASLSKGKIVGVGFSDFIPHDIGTGLKTKSVWMPEWGDINIRALMEDALGLPIVTMRCTDAFSIAENVFGACKGLSAFCVVQLDQGIGLAVFKDGRYLTGSTDIFGELGHTVYRDDGEICKCGNRGCLETYAGTGAIVRKVRESIKKGLYYSERAGEHEITLDDIVTDAREGNKLARLVLMEATKAVGDTISNLVNVLGITRIQLYGELAKAGDLLVQQVMSSIRRHCIYPLNQDTEVRVSELNEYASAIGAAYIVMRKHFEPI